MDACRALGLGGLHAGTSRHTYHIPADEKRVTTFAEIDPQTDCGSKGRGGLRANTKLSLISESGLYKLVMRSDKPVARPFQDWVTREVLPSIRKTGGYKLEPGETMPLPASIAQAFKDGYARAKEELQTRLDAADFGLVPAFDLDTNGRITRVTVRPILPWRL